MKLFLMWGDNPELMEELEKNSHEILYCLDSARGQKHKFPNTVFHLGRHALEGRPADGIDINGFPPPSEELLARLSKTESLILTMMSNTYDKMGAIERKHFYYNLVQYWHGVLQKYQPGAIIFASIPHAVYDFLLFELARMMGIPSIMLADTWSGGRIFVYNNVWEGCPRLHEAIEKNRGRNFSLEDLSEDLREYYKLQTDPRRDATPVYMEENFRQFKLLYKIIFKTKIIFRSILDLSFFAKAVSYIFRMSGQNPRKEYEGLQQEPDFNKKFIYVPLNYQPECTTSPQGGIFVDQILMVEYLSASIPDDWIIYVKEHPTQWLTWGARYCRYRYPGYYEKLAGIKNVRLIPIRSNTFELINKSQAVGTVTGTAGWEAIFREKPSLIFGYPWYRDCPGIFRINSVEAAVAAIKKIISGFKPDKQEIINYLKSFEEATVHAFPGEGVEKYTKLTEEENAKNITAAYLEELARLDSAKRARLENKSDKK